VWNANRLHIVTSGVECHQKFIKIWKTQHKIKNSSCLKTVAWNSKSVLSFLNCLSVKQTILLSDLVFLSWSHFLWGINVPVNIPYAFPYFEIIDFLHSIFFSGIRMPIYKPSIVTGISGCLVYFFFSNSGSYLISILSIISTYATYIQWPCIICRVYILLYIIYQWKFQKVLCERWNII
jgi:hypothetical protein